MAQIHSLLEKCVNNYLSAHPSLFYCLSVFSQPEKLFLSPCHALAIQDKMGMGQNPVALANIKLVVSYGCLASKMCGKITGNLNHIEACLVGIYSIIQTCLFYIYIPLYPHVLCLKRLKADKFFEKNSQYHH